MSLGEIDTGRESWDSDINARDLWPVAPVDADFVDPILTRWCKLSESLYLKM